MARGLDGFAKEALAQTVFFERAGVQVYADVLRAIVGLFEQHEGVRAAVHAAWAERDFFASYERPLLILAALHREAIASPMFPLAPSLFAGAPVEREQIARVLMPPSPVLDTIRSRLVQTNEVTRSVAWRVALPPSWEDTPVALVDLGCSAGLNLVSDRLALSWTVPDGPRLDLASPHRIVERVGLDRAPIDPGVAEAALWLRACLWPGQIERRARLDAAIEAVAVARANAELKLVTLDASAMPAWLEAFSSSLEDARVLAYQCIFAEYLAAEAREAFDAAMREWVVRHEKRAVWVQFETAPRGAPGPVRLTATIARDGKAETLVLGTSEYHPKTVALDRARVDELWVDLA